MTNRGIIIPWIIAVAIIGAFLVYFIRTTIQVGPNDIKANKGVFDFSEINFTDTKVQEIRGEVEFYMDTLLSQDDFAKLRAPKPTAILEIPSKWNDTRISSEVHKGHGYGTYRFTIIVPEKTRYGIKIKDYKMAYTLSVNGEWLGGSGKVGRTKEEMIPSRYQKEFYFQTDTNSLEVLIQVSNFHHRKGGATGTLLFGPLQNIQDWKSAQIGTEALLIGLLFILFIYHLALYTYRRKDLSILYFSLLCLSMFFRAGYIGERIFLEAFNYLGWSITTKIEYVSFMGIPVFTTLFLNNLFPREIKKWLVWSVSSVSIVCMGFVIVLNSTAFSYTALVIQYVLGPASAIIIVMLFIAILRKREYALQVFLGFFIFFILSFHDAISYIKVMDSIYLMPAGLFVATLSQAYVLAQKSSSAYAKAENLAEELQNYANNLEEIVEERTQEIMHQKDKIEQQKVNIETTASELKKSNESLLKLAEYKKNMTHMMVHDLKNPLNNIIGFTAMEGNIDSFKEHIHSSGWKMLNLVKNILDLEKHESSELILNKQIFDLNTAVKSAYSNTEFMLSATKLKFYNRIVDKHQVVADEDIVIRVISNILSNAAKYAKRKGFISISAEKLRSDKDQEFMKINIYNNGNPIPKGKEKEIFNKYYRLSESENEHYHSSGIGLAFCKLAIEAHGGEIGAVSGEEEGVTFWFTLPTEVISSRHKRTSRIP